jgi:methionyl-tRNA formyltransferase
MGTINVHGSLLPQYRGAAPINRAIMNGETETGVTTFKLKHEIDTGDILLQQNVTILPEDNAGTMHDKLMVAGAELLVVTVKGLVAGSLHELPQTTISDADIKHAPKIFKEHLLIDWNTPVTEINNFIRGLALYPAAYTMLYGKSLKLLKIHTARDAATVAPGTVDTDNATYLRFAGNDGWVYADELQLEGKKRLAVVEFLRGYRVPETHKRNNGN